MPDATFYALAIPAVVLIGLAKGGFVGLGALSTPMMALAMSPVRAAAILLPILIVQDVVSVWIFRHEWDGKVLAATLPGSVIGIALGYSLAAEVSLDAVMGVLGLLSVLFGLYRLWVDRHGAIAAPGNSPAWVGTLFGAAAGLASQIAHAGGPPFQMWVLPRRLSPTTFAGTSAIFFAVTNWLKVPAYLALGQFTPANLAASASLMPVAILSTFGGVWLVRRVTTARFYTVVYLLMILLGLRLLYTALA